MSTYKCNRKSKMFVTSRQLYRRAEKEVNDIVSCLNLNSNREIQEQIVGEREANDIVSCLNLNSNCEMQKKIAETVTESFSVDSDDAHLSTNDISNVNCFNTFSNLIEETIKNDTAEVVQNSQESDNYNSIINVIRMWALANSNVSYSSISSLLVALQPFHPELPLDVRTLLKTSSLKFNIKMLTNGQFIYLGID